MVDDILQSFPTDENGNLKVILASWTGHNKQHSEKVRKWVEKAKNVGNEPIYHKALGAAEEMEKANKQLKC